MAKGPKPPAPPPPPPPPVQEIDAVAAGEAEKEFMKGREGAKASWITKGQSLGSGTGIR